MAHKRSWSVLGEVANEVVKIKEDNRIISRKKRGHNKQNKQRRGLWGRLMIMVMFFTLIQPIVMSLPKVEAKNSNDAVSKLQINAGGDEAITADVVNDWIQKTRSSSPLAGKGQMIIDVADKYGVNRAVIIGVMTNETSMGTTGTGKKNNNFGGFKGSYKFDTPEAGVEAVGELIGKYIRKEIGTAKNPTMQQFLDTYSPSYENNHSSMFNIHGSVYNALGVSAREMQQSGTLKNGDPSIQVDYSTDGSDGTSSINVNEACPINCNLLEEQRVSTSSSGADTGKIRVLEKGKLWKNEEDLTETDLGYTSDKTTEANIESFLEDISSHTGEESKADYAKYFLEAGKTSGLDPRFLIAFWTIQTDNGSTESWKEAYNAFGWDTGEDFKDARGGIVEGAKLISINYYNDGQTTVKKMVEDDAGHVVSGDEDWAKSIASLMEKSEKFITESEGKTQEMYDEVGDYDDWAYEQCLGEGKSSNDIQVSGDGYTEQVINWLRDEGFTDESIAGILGNLYRESKVDPRSVQRHGEITRSDSYTDEERDALIANRSNNGAHAAGLAQWESTRFAKVRAKASELGVSPYSLEAQMPIMVEELKGFGARSYGEGKLYDLYKVNDDVEVASTSFAQIFEACAQCHPGGEDGEIAPRLKQSKEYYKKYFQ